MAKNNDQLSLEDIKHLTISEQETINALSNGHFGVRASYPIKVDGVSCNPGTFVNGFYESEKIYYGEWAYGYAKKHQTICKLPSIK